MDQMQRIDRREFTTADLQRLPGANRASASDVLLVGEVSRRYRQEMLGDHQAVIMECVAHAPRAWLKKPSKSAGPVNAWSSIGLMPPAEWIIDQAGFVTALRLARSLTHAGRPLQAIAALEALRPLVYSNPANTAWSSLAAVEVMYSTKRWTQAIDAAQAGLDALKGDAAGGTSGDYYQGSAAEATFLRYDLDRLKHLARLEADGEAYGAASVL